MITIIVKTKVNDMNYDKYTSLMGQLVAASQAEQKNISYEHYENANIPNAFVIVEQWEDAEGLKAHQQADHFQVYWKEIQQLCIQQPEITVFSDENEVQS